MHIENELAEIMTIGEPEFEEIVNEYKEEILMQEEVSEPSLTDSVDTAPAQGKPRCITLIFYNQRKYICCAFMLQEFYENHMHIYIYIS